MDDAANFLSLKQRDALFGIGFEPTHVGLISIMIPQLRQFHAAFGDAIDDAVFLVNAP